MTNKEIADVRWYHGTPKTEYYWDVSTVPTVSGLGTTQHHGMNPWSL